MSDSTEHHDSRIELYWRPGCGFCWSLRRQLDKLGIERAEHNIWDDPAKAAIVRSFANGTETVPTVVIDGVGMVNPSASDVVDQLATTAPELLPEGFEAPQPSAVGRALSRLLG